MLNFGARMLITSKFQVKYLRQILKLAIELDAWK